jgi:hypothetical protein
VSTETPTPPVASWPISQLLGELRGACTNFEELVAQLLTDLDHSRAELHRRNRELENRRRDIAKLKDAMVRQEYELKQLRLLVPEFKSSGMLESMSPVLSDSSASPDRSHSSDLTPLSNSSDVGQLRQRPPGAVTRSPAPKKPQENSSKRRG